MYCWCLFCWLVQICLLNFVDFSETILLTIRNSSNNSDMHMQRTRHTHSNRTDFQLMLYWAGKLDMLQIVRRVMLVFDQRWPLLKAVMMILMDMHFGVNPIRNDSSSARIMHMQIQSNELSIYFSFRSGMFLFQIERKKKRETSSSYINILLNRLIH